MQRRHQKIIQEAPAPNQPARAHPRRRCADNGRRIGYRGASTFEFLYENDEFFFIEMNTRSGRASSDRAHHGYRHRAAADLHCGGPRAFRQRDVVKKARHRVPDQCRGSVYLRTVTGPHHVVSRARRSGIRVDSHVYQNYFVPPITTRWSAR
jgi:acetyl-CoA carboxylase biotin carboxylase subunit